MAERAFLAAVQAHLAGAGLVPAPVLVGPAEPEKATELPALVLSLERAERAGGGVGERVAPVTGALRWQAAVDLANPVLADDPSTVLLDAARKTLVLPHGGLVREDGTEGPLGPGDLVVTVNGNPRVFTSDPAVGTLRFATALPATGTVAARYFVGRWERRVERLAGVLRVDACGRTGAEAAALSDAALDALSGERARRGVKRLPSWSVAGVSSIGAAEPGTKLRRRVLRFTFVFENEVDRPESSGGVIRSIPITAHLG